MATNRAPKRRLRKASTRQSEFKRHVEELFELARELCVLCAVEIAIVVFSPDGRPYTFGYPSVKAVLEKYRRERAESTSDAESTVTEPEGEFSSPAPEGDGDELLNKKQKLETKKMERDGPLLEGSVENFKLE
ncbi:hypothetical protein MLD38_008063 [Melastoma candidum]|uniref:Uncharacterized protein n=1 Tax=Melastoma candidum TaxID=119954 RepID=A0ACB9RTN1_9MYRT|nr:hypothetical protein MLD38_008063 [Melastoma candidum]